MNDNANDKINAVKLSLAQGNPVVMGMRTPSSFSFIAGDVWTPTESGCSECGHALCIVGYDDNKYGGSFEIMNSWGTGWANKGFVWVKYNDFATWAKYAFELIDNFKPTPPPIVVNPPAPTPTPQPKPAPTPITSNDFSGDLRLVLANGSEMKTQIQEVRGLYVSEVNPPQPQPNNPLPNPNTFNPDPNLTIGKFIAYRVPQAYSVGTQFRIYIKNNEPAYVYAIAMDNTNRAGVLFPHAPTISPILNYKNSEIALPSESNYITMDNVKGTDVLCLLYSKEALDINQICRNLEQESGTFFQRLYKVLQNKLVDRQYLRYYNERLRFEIKSYGTGAVVPIVVEIPHN